MSQQQLLSKIATNDKHGENSPYFDGWKAYDRNPFHSTKNPQGVIQMGLAENQLCFDLIEEWIRNNPKASICTPEGVHMFRDIANFQDYHGLPQFRKGVANFMSKARGGRVKYDPERILMSGGATGWRTGVQLVPVHCDSSNNFKVTRESLEEAYDNAKKNSVNVKGLIITNPSNPLGTTLDKETLKSLVSFINEKNIHLVCDEIYAATVFSTPKFVSVSEVMQEMECNKELIHIIYSLSKDMGLPGFRVGIVYSYNDDVVSCGRKMSSFGLVSSQTQHFLASLLSDEDFVNRYLETSKKRLAKRHRFFTKGLETVSITCLPSNSGLFCWMNLRGLLKEQSFEGEMKLWRVIVNEVKLNVSPGSSFNCSESGWFRVCFANMDDETVEVALKRIRAFVGRETNNNNNNGKRVEVKRWKSNNNLRLSFNSRRFDENVMSPHHHMMSPHSPLVRAT
ncbi:acetyl-coenzyme A synthetase 2 [Stylosanthes scabra]|uniref:1-aminocyclopropane-1-carboxylate synthase n=1 Tax=Stylosanthes scabra TaxID=79078 RepID=A0ABU6UF43_9FABA|nr:acetyl-coenzyme A synthetase 2 [Stylosanthes scabra]